VRSTVARADRPTSSNSTLKGAAVKPTPNQPAPDVHLVMKPTRRQLRYLRILAEQTATTFAYPATIDDASVEIARLKALPRSGAGERTRERRAVQRDLAERPDDAAAIRARDVRGYGGSARWAHRPTHTSERS
jgi:hypothetical protein